MVLRSGLRTVVPPVLLRASVPHTDPDLVVVSSRRLNGTENICSTKFAGWLVGYGPRGPQSDYFTCLIFGGIQFPSGHARYGQ
jgi:hypothetical protein